MAPQPHILLLEDDPAIARTAAYALQRKRFVVTHVLLVQEARTLALRDRPSALVLDIALPDGNGLELCRELRQHADAAVRALPMLMLTARAEEIDRVLGLETGADDYLTKPFSPRELVARVRALLRRAALSPPDTTPARQFEHDAAGQRICYAGTWLALTRLEYRLLCTLMAAPGRIHSRNALLTAAWGDTAEPGDRTVDTHIKTLRAKLRTANPTHDPIVTHRGLGWGLADGA